MAERHCKPDADLKWLWQTLVPDMALPLCGMPKKSVGASGESVRPETNPRDEAAPHAKRRAPRGDASS
jgi:hypothetical protein